jgi:hypothetical protein
MSTESEFLSADAPVRILTEYDVLSPEQLAALVLGPDAEVVPAGAYPPSGESCGIYMLFNADGALLYVGKSLGVGYRNLQHHWAAQRGKRSSFVEYAFVPVQEHLLSAVECAYIDALEPPENKARPCTTWRHHAALVRMIREVWGPKK